MENFKRGKGKASRKYNESGNQNVSGRIYNNERKIRKKKIFRFEQEIKLFVS